MKFEFQDATRLTMASPIAVLLTAILWITATPCNGQKTNYNMDIRDDCSNADYIPLTMESVMTINGRSSLSSTNSVQSCRLDFKLTDTSASIRVDFVTFYINDPDVTLIIFKGTLSDFVSLTAGSTRPNTIFIDKQTVTIRLDRRYLDDVEFNFQLTVQAYKDDPFNNNNQSMALSVGAIVGIVGGIIIFIILIFLIIICCCCKHKTKANDDKDAKVRLEEGDASNYSVGYTNETDRNGISTGTPAKLNGRNGKLKLNLRNDDSDDDIKKPPIINFPVSPKAATTGNYTSIESPDKDVPKSPMLAALHQNSKFRAVYEQTEAEAEERSKRISSGSSIVPPSSPGSPTSITSIPPPLPTAPLTPKSARKAKGQNHASIRRAPRPSSSAEEISNIGKYAEDIADQEMQLIDDSAAQHSPPPVMVPIKVNDPHTVDMKPKHTLKPQRGRSPEEQRKKTDSPTVAKREMESAPASKKTGMYKQNTKPPKPTFGDSTGLGSLRKRGHKSPRLGSNRNRSGSQPELDTDQSSRPGTPTSMVSRMSRTDDLDAFSRNPHTLRRSGSRNSLYSSRTSLYGRRGKRRSSFSESVSTYAQDDLDAYAYEDEIRMQPVTSRSRASKSLGDIAYGMKEISTQTLRETATQTGAGQTAIAEPKRTVPKKTGNSRSVSTSGSQTKTKKRSDSASKEKISKSGGKRKSKSVSAVAAGPDESSQDSADQAGPIKGQQTSAPQPIQSQQQQPTPVAMTTNPNITAPFQPYAQHMQTVLPQQPQMLAPQPVLMAPPQQLPPQQQQMVAPQLLPQQPMIMRPPTGPVVTGITQGFRLPHHPEGHPESIPAYVPPYQHPAQAPTYLPSTDPNLPTKSPWERLCELTDQQQQQQAQATGEVGSIQSSMYSGYPGHTTSEYGHSSRSGPRVLQPAGYVSAASEHSVPSMRYSQQGPPPDSMLPPYPQHQGEPPQANMLPRKSSYEALKELTDTQYKLHYGSQYDESESNV